MPVIRTVMLTVDTTGDQEFVTVYERLARQAAGLILDGIEARVTGFLPDDESEET